jgi:carboxypeptidase family protein
VNPGTVTQSPGSFNLTLEAGTYLIAATCSGYNDSSRSVTVDVGVATVVDITLVKNTTSTNHTGNHSGPPAINGTTPAAFPTELVGIGLIVVAVFAVAAGAW